MDIYWTNYYLFLFRKYFSRKLDLLPVKLWSSMNLHSFILSVCHFTVNEYLGF